MTLPVNGVVVHTQMGSELTGGSGRTDGQGYQFDAQITMPFPASNNPPVDIFMVPPGGPWPQEPTYKWIPVGKAVAVYLDFSGTDLLVKVKSHGFEPGNRTLRTEVCVIPGVWHVIGNEAQKEGGVGAYIPSGGGGGPEVDYDQVELRIRKVLELPMTVGGETLGHRFSGVSGGLYRKGLQDKAVDAIAASGVLTTANAKDALYQITMDRVYQTFADNVPGFWAWLNAQVAGGKVAVEPTAPTQESK